jgi:two-component system sporulation sensor kinase C
MQASYLSELDEDQRPVVVEALSPTVIRAGAAILVLNPLHQRLIETAAIQLKLAPALLNGGSFQPETLASFELIVADEAIAQQISVILSAREERREGVNPAVIAVREHDMESPLSPDQMEHTIDGFLNLPMAPAEVAAHIAVILYAHRAFARRYQSSLEELHLNRRIFSSVTSGISVASATLPDMPLLYVNPAFEVMTGYSLKEIQGKNCRFLQNDQHDQPALTVVREALANQREVVTVIKNFRKDGTPFWNELYLSPIRNREGTITHFVGIQQDVTARVEFEDALRESEKLAAVGRLASSIAHEINNPLEAMMNLLYLAQRSNDLAETRSYLTTADRELQRVKLITSQSLRFYKQSTKPRSIGCTELLDSLLDLYLSRIRNRSIVVERRERSTRSIVCMESEIRQVLNNLITNALDAMRGGGRLLVRTREATEWRSHTTGVLVTIADTGSGMSRMEIKSIYKAFYTTKGIGGTGLGLWISSEIVQRHQGRLMVRSTPHNPSSNRKSGTVFQLFLPFQILPS